MRSRPGTRATTLECPFKAAARVRIPLGMPAEQASDQALCTSADQPGGRATRAGTHPGHTSGSLLPELDDRTAALEPLHQGIEPVDGLVRPVLEEAAVPGQREGHAVVAGPLGDLANV